MAASTRIKAGELRHRIQLVKPTLVQDLSGGVQEDQQPKVIATLWASIEALSGRELYAAQQKVSDVTHQVTMRWMAGVTANLNVRFEGREFQILTPLNPDERHKKLILLCRERDDSAREQGATAL